MNQSRVVKSACALCLACCGINIHVEDDKIVKVTGMQEHPASKGRLCVRGASSHEWVCSPNRLRYPMKRQNGDWNRISWDEALDIIARKLTDTKQEHGARTVASLMGMSILAETFFTQGVASRFLCFESGDLAGRACPRVFEEFFLLENVPESYCALHKRKGPFKKLIDGFKGFLKKL